VDFLNIDAEGSRCKTVIEYHGISDNFDVEGKTAIITGGTRGIGYATAELFVRKGVNVVLIGRSAEIVDSAAALGKKACAARGDITSKEFISETMKDALHRFGSADILVNNAGVVALESAEVMSEETWDMTLDVNLKGVFLMSQAFGAMHIENKTPGAIVNVASQAGVIALDKHAAYSSSKGGMIALTRALAFEWAKYGIRVNCVSPTYVTTDSFKKGVDWQGQEGRELLKLLPAGRFAEPAEVAASIVFLAGDNAAMITGQNLILDGGYTIL